MYNIDENEEIEINLTEFMWKLLIQWKPMLLVAIACAIVVGGYKYASQSRAAKAVQQEARSEADIEKTLSDEDLEGVDTAVKTKEDIEAFEDYQSNSPLMSIDAYNERTVIIKYSIRGTAAAASGDLDIIAAAYNTYINSNDFALKLKEKLGWGYDDRYISELVYHEGKGLTGSVNVYIQDDSSIRIIDAGVIIPDEAKADEVETAVNEILNEYKPSDGRYEGSYTFEEIGANEQVTVDTQTVQTQAANFTTLNTKKTELKSLEDALEGDALLLYNMYTKDDEDSEASVESSDTQTYSGGVSVKYIAIGFFIGMVLYAGVLFVLYIIRPKVSRVTDVDEILPGRGVGRLTGATNKTNTFINSPFIQKIHEGEHRALSEQAEEISSAIEFKIKNSRKPEAKLSYIYWADVTDTHRSILTAFADDEKLVELPVDDMEATYRIFDDIENAVLIFEDERTSIKRVREVVHLLCENSSDIIAYVSLG